MCKEGFLDKRALANHAVEKLHKLWRKGKLPCKQPAPLKAQMDRWHMLFRQVSPSAENVKKHIARRIHACQAKLELYRREGRRWWHADEQYTRAQWVSIWPC